VRGRIVRAQLTRVAVTYAVSPTLLARTGRALVGSFGAIKNFSGHIALCR
jgi:hypothetical protein